VGWGAALNDQPSTTVEGDQSGNAELAAQLWSAVTSGTSIADIAAGSAVPGLADFTKTIRTITINPSILTHLSDQQVCDILGLDAGSFAAAGGLASMKQYLQAEASFTIHYGASSNGMFATSIDYSYGSRQVAMLSLTAITPATPAISALEQGTGAAALTDMAARATAALLGR
jgi:hypothetical protein